MTRYIASRIGWGILTLFLFVTLLFFVVNAAVPGDWTSQFILTADERRALQEQLGIDRPLWEQYVSWLGAAVTLDFGVSLSGQSVWDATRDALATTLLVLLVGLGIAFALGYWLGRVTTWSRRGWLIGSVTFVAIVMLTAFPPALAFALERVTINALGRGALVELAELDSARLAESGMTDHGVTWRMVIVIVAVALLAAALVKIFHRSTRRRLPLLAAGTFVIVGAILVWWLLGIDGLAFDVAGQALLLVVGVLILTFGEVILITRATMEETMREDFVMVARAKGLSEREVRDRHAARAALLPILSRLVVAIPYFLTGLVILESVFGHGGTGSLLFQAMLLQDTSLVVGLLLLVGVITVVLRVGLDVAHAVLDPRIASGTAGNG